jgi:hypothetical protein
MGRHRKYITEEEKRQANKEKYMRYYWRNVKRRRKDALKRYYENKNDKNKLYSL